MHSLNEISKEELFERLTFLESALFSVCGRPRLNLPVLSDKIENTCDEYRKKFKTLLQENE
jgi:hypothetical protein